MTHGFLKAIDIVKKDLSNFAVRNKNLDYRALCRNVHDLGISSLLHCLHDSLHKNRMDLSNIGVRNPKLDHSVLQNLLLSGIHESLHNNSVDLTEIFKLDGNPKPDHSVLPKHDHKNGGSVVIRKMEDVSNVSNLAADSETIPNHENSSDNVEHKRGRRNRVIGGFNVTDIGNDVNALAKMDKKNEKHAFPWMVRVFGDCGSM